MNPDFNKQKAQELLQAFGGDLAAATNALNAAKQSTINNQAVRKVVDGPVIIKVDEITKTYMLGKKQINALNGVSLEIKQGEFVVLTGTSGSGKSTLLQLIGGLDKPSSGNITVAGKEIGKLRDSELSTFRNQTIGFVFQFFYLQPFLDLQTNLVVPAMFAKTARDTRKTRAQFLAGQVGLSDRINHLPKALSGGQMQRAAVARALLNEPKLLLADEPTGNLDSANSKAIIELFQKVRQDFGTTVVVVTHDQVIADQADRKIVLSDGRIQP